MFDTFGAPLQQMNEEVEQQLLSLAMTIARQARAARSCKTDPAQVIAIIRETVSLLRRGGATSACICIRRMRRSCASASRRRPSDRAWTILEDPVMTRGGCKVTTDNALIDARVETRLNEVIQRDAR